MTSESAFGGKAMFKLFPTILIALLGVGVAGAQESIRIMNGLTGDGELIVDPDTFGAVSNWTWAANADQYDPAAAATLDRPTKAAALFMFADPNDRVVFAARNRDLDNHYNNRLAGGRTIDYEILVPLAGFDLDGDGVIDTAVSSFRAFGGAGNFDIRFDLTQTVDKPPVGSAVARLRQFYRITNQATVPAQFRLARRLDADLPWDGLIEDVAGSDSAAGTINPYIREPSSPTMAEIVSLGGTAGYFYLSSKQGFDPDGSGPDPALGFGSDFLIWDNFGMPASWRNYTAGVGHNVIGELPVAQPPGSTPPFDAFMNLEWSLVLAPGAGTTIEVITAYGGPTPVFSDQCECPGDVNGDGLLDSRDIRAMTACVLDQVAPELCLCADMNQDQSVTFADIDLFVEAVLDGNLACSGGGVEMHETPDDPLLASSYTFGAGTQRPIPPDFFFPGSQPIVGPVTLIGQPLDWPATGPADTIVKRDPPFIGAPTETTMIQLVALSLIGADPITVLGPTGGGDRWFMNAVLSHVAPAPGVLIRSETHPNGGIFDAVLPVQPAFVFTKADDLVDLQNGLIGPGSVNVRVFDTGLLGHAPTTLQLAEPGDWVRRVCQEFVDLNQLVVPRQIGDPFIPGLVQTPPPSTPPNCVAFGPALSRVAPGMTHVLVPPAASRLGVATNRCEYPFSGSVLRLGSCTTGPPCTAAPPTAIGPVCGPGANCPPFLLRPLRCGTDGWCIQVYWNPACGP